MLCLISPTKTLAEETCAKAASAGALLLEEAHKKLVSKCKSLSKSEIKSLMAPLSDKLAELNHSRYQQFEAQPLYPAAHLFDGPSFKALNVQDFDKDELARLDRSLCILSGLYGLLRPSDTMQPYRLEMGAKLSTEGASNLYEFWKANKLTDTLAALARENSAHTILNCASQEYAKVVDFKRLRETHGLKVIDCNFKSSSGRMPAVYAKQARGMMVRFVAKSCPASEEDLKAFSGTEGLFKFSPKDSTDSVFTFLRYDKTQTPGGDEARFKPKTTTLATNQAVKQDGDAKQEEVKEDDEEKKDKAETKKVAKRRSKEQSEGAEGEEGVETKKRKKSKTASADSENGKKSEDGLRRSSRLRK